MQGFRRADYIWMNETWDLKRIKKHSKNTITTAVSNAKNQSQNVILDLQNDSYKDFDIIAEMKRVYGNKRFSFVDKIIISYNMKLRYIFKRR